MRQGALKEPEENMEYLKKTANLGELVHKMQRPWYVKAKLPLEEETTVIKE